MRRPGALTSPKRPGSCGGSTPICRRGERSFAAREPLTRIRDIAHRNDIPAELKQEIKHRLQNKLHRCAGPESCAPRRRSSADHRSGGQLRPAFVQEFRLFHEELQEFFNAAALESRIPRPRGNTPRPWRRR